MDFKRFILAENLRHLRERVQQVADVARPQVEQLIVTAERELAMFDAEDRGAGNRWDGDGSGLDDVRNETLGWFRGEFETSPTLASLIDPRPGLMIVDVNPVYAAATGKTPPEIAGRPLFVAFPDSTEDPEANGVANLYASLRRVADSGIAERMPVQRYDTRHPDTGDWVERYWRIDNSAIKDGSGRLVYLLHLVAEVPPPIQEPAA